MFISELLIEAVEVYVGKRHSDLFSHAVTDFTLYCGFISSYKEMRAGAHRSLVPACASFFNFIFQLQLNNTGGLTASPNIVTVCLLSTVTDFYSIQINGHKTLTLIKKLSLKPTGEYMMQL